MSQQLTILGISAAATVVFQLSGFFAAYALGTEVFYDIFGGLNFLLLGVFSAYAGGSPKNDHPWVSDGRKMACTAAFSLSRAWLLCFLAWRAHERGGDSRFDNVKNRFGLFLTYWMVQAVWVFAISMPLVFVNSSEVWRPEFTLLDWIGLVGFFAAVILEIVADVQKAIWVKRGRTGGFMRSGVWAFSRHPNYFGEILQWWCAWLYAYGSGSGIGDVQWWVAILSPLFTMQVLLNTGGTGVPNCNGKSLSRYYDKFPEEYTAYRKNTSILVPMVGYGCVPMFLKRTIFLDLEKWEYRPSSEYNKADFTIIGP